MEFTAASTFSFALSSNCTFRPVDNFGHADKVEITAERNNAPAMKYGELATDEEMQKALARAKMSLAGIIDVDELENESDPN